MLLRTFNMLSRFLGLRLGRPRQIICVMASNLRVAVSEQGLGFDVLRNEALFKKALNMLLCTFHMLLCESSCRKALKF